MPCWPLFMLFLHLTLSLWSLPGFLPSETSSVLSSCLDFSTLLLFEFLPSPAQASCFSHFILPNAIPAPLWWLASASSFPFRIHLPLDFLLLPQVLLAFNGLLSFLSFLSRSSCICLAPFDTLVSFLLFVSSPSVSWPGQQSSFLLLRLLEHVFKHKQTCTISCHNFNPTLHSFGGPWWFLHSSEIQRALKTESVTSFANKMWLELTKSYLESWCIHLLQNVIHYDI